MKVIKLTKATSEEVEILQAELFYYSEAQKYSLPSLTITDFLDVLIIKDVALRLWYTFRTKVESNNSKLTISLKVNEACILLKCCIWKRENRTSYESFIIEKYKAIIDQQLKSI